MAMSALCFSRLTLICDYLVSGRRAEQPLTWGEGCGVPGYVANRFFSYGSEAVPAEGGEEKKG